MVLIQDVRRSNSLGFANQRRVVHLRDDKGMSWDNIADPENGVRTIDGHATTRPTVQRAYAKLKNKRGSMITRIAGESHGSLHLTCRSS